MIFLHHVIDISFDKYGDLVKVVIMVFHLPSLLIRKVEQSEFAI